MFPKLYALDSNIDCTLAEKRGNGGWNWNWKQDLSLGSHFSQHSTLEDIFGVSLKTRVVEASFF